MASSLADRSLLERVFHAISFEALGIALSAPLLAWLMGVSVLMMGALAVLVATTAMLWNMLFNWLFDRWLRWRGGQRTLKLRVVHAILFELGLIVATVPLAAWWLSVDLMTAFWLEAGLLLFFLPYAFLFNLCYDHLRANLVGRTV